MVKQRRPLQGRAKATSLLSPCKKSPAQLCIFRASPGLSNSPVFSNRAKAHDQ